MIITMWFFYAKHIHVFFDIAGVDRIIDYQDIKTVNAPEEECAFSHLILELTSGEKVTWYFVDYPVQVKSFIEDRQRIDQEFEASAA
jgi:hypothetical protein